MSVLPWDSANLTDIADYFLQGKLVVLPTDTLYGVLAVAKNPEAVEKVYRLKGRNPAKPVIILISEVGDLKKLSVSPTEWQMKYLDKYWPGKVSIILTCETEELRYLHRGANSLAFRLPDDERLRELIKLTGPLIAPSANPEGLAPALNMAKAQEYFGDRVALYVDGGERNSLPSTLVSLVGDKLQVLRGQPPV